MPGHWAKTFCYNVGFVVWDLTILIHFVLKDKFQGDHPFPRGNLVMRYEGPDMMFPQWCKFFTHAYLSFRPVVISHDIHHIFGVIIAYTEKVWCVTNAESIANVDVITSCLTCHITCWMHLPLLMHSLLTSTYFFANTVQLRGLCNPLSGYTNGWWLWKSFRSARFHLFRGHWVGFRSWGLLRWLNKWLFRWMGVWKAGTSTVLQWVSSSAFLLSSLLTTRPG